MVVELNLDADASLPAQQSEVAVQATNDSSIMSKHSMIRLGYVDDPYLARFLHHSNRKVPRRAPLIHRGYYIRFQAINHILHRFLDFFAEIPVQVVSLGCGFDATYFRLTHPQLLYVDVDFPALIERKRAMKDAMDRDPNTATCTGHPGSTYTMIPCDLRKLDQLATLLGQLPGFSFHRPTLLLSECVITYLPTEQADAVLRWGSSNFADVAFVLYEQIHPNDTFAKTMLHHFDKRNAPIFAIHKYPTLPDHCQRLRALGYPFVDAVDMNAFWYECLSAEERERIQNLEWFDEYEEWHLKCLHYFVACGTKETRYKMSAIRFQREPKPAAIHVDHSASPEPTASAIIPQFSPAPDVQRWGHTCTPVGDGRIFMFGGYGVNARGNQCGRLADLQELQLDEHGGVASIAKVSLLHDLQPRPRMYHTAVFWKDAIYVFGGRDGPSKACADLWRFDCKESIWSQVIGCEESDNVPAGRFRHAALLVELKDDTHKLPAGTYMFVHGGITAAEGRLHVLGDLWAFGLESSRWYRIPVPSIPLHSHQLAFLNKQLFFFGGLNGTHDFASVPLALNLTSFEIEQLPFAFPCYGFQSCLPFLSSYPSVIMFVGGMALKGEGDVTLGSDVALVDLKTRTLIHRPLAMGNDWMPLGIQAVVHRDHMILIGGGAVCFSMGSFMNADLLRMSLEWCRKECSLFWKSGASLSWIREAQKIPVISVDDPSLHERLSLRQPLIIRGADIGSCVREWTNRTFLSSAVPEPIKISAHVCSQNRLGFAGNRNYAFEVFPWSEFVDKLFEHGGDGQNYYLRSIGENPRKEPANMARSFPTLAETVQLDRRLVSFMKGSPEETPADTTLPSLMEEPVIHSSVLRISSPRLHLWTHFDILDNYLVQVTGEKFITVFPPSQSENLYVAPEMHASSSPVLNIFSPFEGPLPSDPRQSALEEEEQQDRQKFPKFFEEAVRHARVEILRPGDILFIPALWFHNTFALEGSQRQPVSSVNIFWKHLDTAEYDRKDLYGNKDLTKAVAAWQHLIKAKELVEDIGGNLAESSSYRHFYLAKMKQVLASME